MVKGVRNIVTKRNKQSAQINGLTVSVNDTFIRNSTGVKWMVTEIFETKMLGYQRFSFLIDNDKEYMEIDQFDLEVRFRPCDKT